MFKMMKYAPDMINGSLDLQVIYHVHPKGLIHTESKFFTRKEDGDKWLYQLKRDYITMKIERFLEHKRFIIDGAPGHKSLDAKRKALAELDRYLIWACEQGRPLIEICTWAVKMREGFETVMPSASNPSYLSSRDELSQIRTFCEAEIKSFELRKAG